MACGNCNHEKHYGAFFLTLGTIAFTVVIVIGVGCLAVVGLVKLCIWLGQ